MEDITPELISEDQFNDGVRQLASSLKFRLQANTRSMGENKGRKKKYEREKKGYTEIPLEKSIRSSVRLKYDVATGIRVSFALQGIFFHYGVGRGYVNSGGQLRRGSRFSQEDIIRKTSEKYTRREAASMKHLSSSNSIKRKPVDWFDHEMEYFIPRLANQVKEYYGDKFLKDILYQLDKAKIVK